MAKDSMKKKLEALSEENLQLADANQKLNERLIELYTLYSIAKSLSLTLDIKEIFEKTISMIGESLKVDEYCLMMIDEGNDRLTIRAHHGMSDDILNNVNVSVGEGVSGKVAATGKSLLVQDISKEKNFFYYRGSNIKKGSFLGVPLKLQPAF